MVEDRPRQGKGDSPDDAGRANAYVSDVPKKPAPQKPAMPSREDILAFIARERAAAGEAAPQKIGKREIARAFGIRGDDKNFFEENPQGAGNRGRDRAFARWPAREGRSAADRARRHRLARPRRRPDRHPRRMGGGTRTPAAHNRFRAEKDASGLASGFSCARNRRPRAAAGLASARDWRPRLFRPGGQDFFHARRSACWESSARTRAAEAGASSRSTRRCATRNSGSPRPIALTPATAIWSASRRFYADGLVSRWRKCGKDLAR